MFNPFGEIFAAAGRTEATKQAGRSSRASRDSQLGEAELMLDNAKARLNAGIREASYERYKGEVVQSDATAEMAASGATVDVHDLARLKKRTDFNSISALFDAKQQSGQMTLAAHRKKVDAYTNHRHRARGAVTGAFVDAMGVGTRFFSGFGGGEPSTTSTYQNPGRPHS